MPLISLLQRAVHRSCHLEGICWLHFSPTLPQSARVWVCVGVYVCWAWADDGDHFGILMWILGGAPCHKKKDLVCFF